MTYLSMKQGQTRLKASAGIVLAVFMASEVSAQPVGWASRNGGTSGGAGGSRVRASTGTQIHQALCSRASSDTPIIIEVSGKITPGNTDKVSGDSCNTKAGVIELKDVSNVTLVGVGSGATFDEIGIHIRSSSNIILQNLYIRDVKKSNGTTSNGGDAIGMEKDVRNVWVDHCTLEAFGGEKQGYDGLLDMKNNTRYVTVSYTRYMNSGRGGLVGSSESDKNDFVTYHHNWWMNLKSRAPLLRHANAHIFNNLYDGIKDSGINVRAGGRALVENNYFVDSRNPLGTFYTNTNGTWEVSGNIFSNVVWQETSSQRPAGPNVRSTGGVSVPYSYSLDQANCVRDIVRKTAGANKGLRRSNGSCSNPTNPEPDPEPAPQPDPEPAPQPDPEPAPQPDPEPNPGGGEGTNLAIGAGSDGSSKASGSSYGNVRDGKLSSYWSPKSSSGERISVKKMKGSFNTVIVRELNGATSSWRLINADNGTVLGSGGSLGSSRVISGFGTISAKKISLMIDDASSPPQIAEIEIYN